MSTTIDSKVVEMRFDNKHFETHTKETLSTLDKLKQKLNLTGASKGLEQINTSANKVDMKGMSSALDTVHSKFSALEIMGITALANITNSAVEAGKRMVKALTVDPVMDGFKEYEMTLNAIQTTMAGTGKTAEEVEEQIKRLDEYADKTIYSTADMLNNLPKFTNAGVELDKATTAMIGIANATALAGGDAGKASIAFYNLGQAIGTGYLTRMDYNSINNAGIATMEWKNQMVEAAIAAGTLSKAGDNLYKVGNKTMTLQQLFIDGLQHQWATTDVMMKVFGDYGDVTTEIGKKAQSSAQDIKTFTMMMESLKATAGTGWKDTWQIIFGDLDEAKEFWTDLTNFISGIIEGMADFRNNLLEGALGKGLKKFGKTLSSITKPAKNAAKVVDNMGKALEDMETMVKKVIRGDFGNGKKRFDELTEGAYNYYAIQNKVNETLGNSFRYSDELVESQNKINKATEEGTEAVTELEGSEAERLEQLTKLTEAEIDNLDLKPEQIEALKELKRFSEKTGLSIKEIMDNIDEIDGRWLIINSFKNIGGSIVKIFESIGSAWSRTIGVITSDNLFDMIAGFHKLSESLSMSEETAGYLERTFAGLFAIIDAALTIFTGPLGIAIKIFMQFLDAMGWLPKTVLEGTAVVGDAFVAFNKWLDEVIDLSGVFEFLAPYIKDFAAGVGNFIDSIKNSDAIQNFVKWLTSAKEAVVNWFEGLKEAEDIPKYIFEGLWNGFTSGVKGIIDFIVEFGKQILSSFKEVLGIHSPSTEFFEAGKDLVLGLFNGIKTFIEMVYNLVMSVGNKLIEIIKGLNLPSIIGLAVGGGVTFLVVQIARLIGGLASPFEGFGDILDQLKGTLRSFKFRIYAESIKSMAIAIAILAASVYVLAKLDQDKLFGAVIAIGALMGILVAMVYLTDKYGGGALDTISFGKLALVVLGFGLAMMLMAKALKNIASIESEKATQALIGFAGAIAALMLVIRTVSKNHKEVANIGGSLLAIAAALLLMSYVVKILGNMDPEQLKQGVFALLAFSGIIVGLMVATKLISKSKNVDKIGKAILGIGTALLMMAVVAKICATMTPEQLTQGIIAILIFSGIIVGLMAATKLLNGSKNVGAIGGAILGIGAALLLMAATAKICATMTPGDLVKGVLTIAAFSGIIVGLMAATKLLSGSKNVGKIGLSILAVSGALLIMAAVAKVCSTMTPEDLTKGVIAVAVLSLLMMGLIAVTKKVPKKITGTMFVLAATIGVLAAALAVLSKINPGNLAVATLTISAVLGMFALVIKATKNVKKVAGTLLVLTLAIGVLAGALYLLASLPTENVLASAIALTLVMLAMSTTMLVMSGMGKLSAKALLGVVGLIAICAALYLVVGALALMSGIENAASNAMVLAAFLGVLAIVQLLCAAAGAIYAATGMIAMLGLVGMVALIGTLYLIIGALALMEGLPNAITNLKALQSFMIVMTGILVVLAIVGPLAMLGVSAMGALTMLMGVIGVFAVAIGALMQKFPAIQSFLDTGLPVLIQLAGAIGKMIGAFVSGILTQISSSLPEIGMHLSMFMTNAMGFIMGAKLVDEKVLAGVGILAGAILALTVVDLINGIAAFLSGGTSFAKLGTELSLFLMNAMPFILLSKQIDPAIMTGVKSLAEAVMILTGANVIEGLTSWFTGGNSLEKFGSQLGNLGTNLNQFVTNLGTFTQDQVTTVDCAGRAIKALAESAKALPNDGGWLGAICGENSLATFAGYLPDLATKMGQFVNNLGTFDEAKVNTVDCAGRAIKALAEAAKEIPNDGGLWGAICGENSLATFGSYLPNLGTNLNGFITNLGSFNDAHIKTVECAGTAIIKLAEAAKTIPNEGGLWAKIVGDNSLATFAGHLPGLGTKINEFVSALGTFNQQQVSSVNAACEAIKAIAGLGQIDVKDTGSKLEDFGSNMVKFAKKVKDFVNKVGDVGGDSISSAITKTKDLIEMSKTVADVNVESIKSFGDSLKNFAKDGVKGFVEEFSGETPKKESAEAVKAMVQAGIDGAEDKKDEVKKEFGFIAAAAVTALCNNKIINGATNAGKDLVEGFANGIKNNKSLAKDAGSEIGKAALKAAKEAIDSNSPSKEAMKLGNFFGEGFVGGIRDYAYAAYSESYAMADNAKSGLSRAISRISDLIESDMDTQPTIRPVLDLSNVESGVGAIGSMFGSPSLGVMANLNSISSGMNARNQNGANDDVVLAIDRLRKGLGNGGNTYNINGITYDDGSNINKAVETLINAAVVERRR